MARHFKRSITVALRGELSWSERWEGADKGLILCWENGRQLRLRDSAIAKRADQGELVTLPWKGGTENIDETKKAKTKAQARYGTLKYLATWQGLRGEDLDIPLDGEIVIVCSKTKRSVIFREVIPIPD